MIKELAGKVVDWMEKISDQQYQLGANEVIAGYRYSLRVVEQSKSVEHMQFSGR